MSETSEWWVIVATSAAEKSHGMELRNTVVHLSGYIYSKSLTVITLIIYVKFKVLTAVIFWAMTPCRRFRGTCLHVRSRRVSQQANNRKLAEWQFYLHLQGRTRARKLQTSRKIYSACCFLVCLVGWCFDLRIEVAIFSETSVTEILNTLNSTSIGYFISTANAFLHRVLPGEVISSWIFEEAIVKYDLHIVCFSNYIACHSWFINEVRNLFLSLCFKKKSKTKSTTRW
jgi:hypothetical protein